MTFIKSTADDYLDLLDELVENVTSHHVATATVNAGGTGYAAGDILTVAGGTSTQSATIEVLTESSGVIATVRVEEGGAYTVDPPLSANAVTGGTGSGATMTLTMEIPDSACVVEPRRRFPPQWAQAALDTP